MNMPKDFNNISDDKLKFAFEEMNKEALSGYVCPFCGEKIADKKNVVWINKHEKSFKCPGCREKVFWLK
jgi:DNA-directed RNA polymerase subunit RPC12/RpoP